MLHLVRVSYRARTLLFASPTKALTSGILRRPRSTASRLTRYANIATARLPTSPRSFVASSGLVPTPRGGAWCCWSGSKPRRRTSTTGCVASLCCTAASPGSTGASTRPQRSRPSWSVLCYVAFSANFVLRITEGAPCLPPAPSPPPHCPSGHAVASTLLLPAFSKPTDRHSTIPRGVVRSPPPMHSSLRGVAVPCCAKPPRF